MQFLMYLQVARFLLGLISQVQTAESAGAALTPESLISFVGPILQAAGVKGINSEEIKLISAEVLALVQMIRSLRG